MNARLQILIAAERFRFFELGRIPAQLGFLLQQFMRGIDDEVFLERLKAFIQGLADQDQTFAADFRIVKPVRDFLALRIGTISFSS